MSFSSFIGAYDFTAFFRASIYDKVGYAARTSSRCSRYETNFFISYFPLIWSLNSTRDSTDLCF